MGSERNNFILFRLTVLASHQARYGHGRLWNILFILVGVVKLKNRSKVCKAMRYTIICAKHVRSSVVLIQTIHCDDLQ